MPLPFLFLRSIFYVYYEQYTTIVNDSIMNLGVCLAAIFTISFVLLAFDFFTAIIITGTIAMITVDLMGLMYLWGIDLNAISLVNLIMVSRVVKIGGRREKIHCWSSKGSYILIQDFPAFITGCLCIMMLIWY